MGSNILKYVRDVVIEQDCMWILTSTLNSIFKYDFIKRELELEAIFPKTIQEDFDPFFRMIKIENELYFMPRLANDIVCYDIDKKFFYELNVPFKNFQNSKNIGVVTYEGTIYCLNRYPDVVIKIDSLSKKIDIFESKMSYYQNINIESKIYGMYRNPCIYHKKIIWPNYNNIIGIFDIESKTFSVEQMNMIMPERVERWSDAFKEDINDFVIEIKSIGNNLMFITVEGNIYWYNAEKVVKIENNILDKYMHYNDDDGIRCPVIYDVIQLNKELLIIPSYKNNCIRFSADTMQCEEVLQGYLSEWEGNRKSYSCCKVIDNHICLLFSYYECCFFVLDVEKDVVYKKKIEVPYEKFANENTKFEEVIVKNGMYRFDHLKYFLDMLKTKNVQGEDEKMVESVGEKIFNDLDLCK